jgi:hypothetical protein
MNVSGPTGALNAYRMLGGLAGAPAAQPARPAAPAVPTAPAAPAAPAQGAAQAAAAQASAVPAGSDPALWSILTSQERDFFLRHASLGAVTYGPTGAGAAGRSAAAMADTPVGQRIDIRA